MTNSEGFKFGDSKSLGDQTLELVAGLDTWFAEYLSSKTFGEIREYMSEEDMLLIDNGYELMKRCEMLLISYADSMERTEHKIDKIYKLVEEINLK